MAMPYSGRRNVCPQADLHTPAPSTYLAWWEWADEMGKTHVERKCPGCGLWRIWEPKPSQAERLRASADRLERDAPAFARTLRRTADQLDLLDGAGSETTL